jgi:hypothetical protein
MAENKLLLMNNSVVGGTNVLTDIALKATAWDETGIAINEVAHSSRLNSILRQLSSVTHPLVDFLVEELNVSFGSYVDTDIEVVTAARIRGALNAVIDIKVQDKRTLQTANQVWAGPASGASTAPAFRALAALDIPELATSKITTGTFAAARIATDAIETVKIKNLNVTETKIATSAVTSGKIAANAVAFTKIVNSVAAGLSVVGRSVATAGNFGEINAGADGQVLRRSGTALGFGTIVAAGIAANAVETAKIKDLNVTKAKLGTDVLSGGLILDGLISAKHSSVVGKVGMTGNTYASYTIRFVTQAEYDAGTKETNTFYVITD